MLIQSTKNLNDIKDKVSKSKTSINGEIKTLKDILKTLSVPNYNFSPLENEISKLINTISLSVEKQINENAKIVGQKISKEIR
jgi:K+/H+ antiporter YhaU regulatory subunit KhtT